MMYPVSSCRQLTEGWLYDWLYYTLYHNNPLKRREPTTNERRRIYNNFLQLFLSKSGILLKRERFYREKYCCVPLTRKCVKRVYKNIANLYIWNDYKQK